MDHPIAPEDLARFVAGTATREENRRIVAHLLRGCAGCARQMEAFLGRPDEGEHGYDAAFDRFERLALRAGRARPAGLPFLPSPPL